MPGPAWHRRCGQSERAPRGWIKFGLRIGCSNDRHRWIVIIRGWPHVGNGPEYDVLHDVRFAGAALTKEEKVKLRVQQRLLNAERRLMPNATEIDLAEQSEVNAELDRRISDMIVRQDGGWVCTVCGKQANHKSKLKQHAETHLQGYSHPCIMCGKTYRSRYNIGTCGRKNVIILMLDKTFNDQCSQPGVIIGGSR